MHELPNGDLYIGGEWSKGRGAPITSIFPADKSENLTLNGASLDDLSLAISRAEEAQAAPAWRNMKAHERANLLINISAGITKNLERIAHVQSRDTGKTLKETRALAMSAAGTFRYYASVVEVAEDAITPARGDYLTFSTNEPLGVVAGISPWNSPIASDAQKIAPALAAGNAFILKPSSWSPMVSLVLAEIMHEAGVPRGIFSTLPGAGRLIGDALVKDKAIQKLSFTGGNAVGNHIARLAADKTMPISLELGGKSPTIVFADADIEQALAGVLFGIFSSTGQSCIAGSRLFVEKSIYKSFVERLVKATQNLVVGHPFDEKTQVAPLIREPHRADVEKYIKLGQDEGGKIIAGGHRPEGLDAGIYLRPTIIEGLGQSSRLAQEEIFGPVLLVMPFENEESLINDANDSIYGLACGIWTRDFVKAWRIAKAIKAGTIWVNTYKVFSIATPFGGHKQSGMGYEKGIAGLRGWQAQKSIYVDLSGQPFPWAASTVRDSL
jgi:betaine-aldehyde dehydrogenase